MTLPVLMFPLLLVKFAGDVTKAGEREGEALDGLLISGKTGSVGLLLTLPLLLLLLLLLLQFTELLIIILLLLLIFTPDRFTRC